MRSTQPPAVATWLLRHLGSSPHNDSIIGDLIEQYQHAQGFTIVCDDPLRHDRRTFYSPSTIWYWKQCLKAIVVGLFSECRAHKWLTVRALITGWTMFVFVFPRSFEPIRELLFALEAWSRWWRGGWLLPMAWTCHAVPISIIVGWLIARFHRPYQIPMVLMFALSSCVVTWLLFLGAARWPPYIIVTIPLGAPFLIPISIMFGGGLFRSHVGRRAILS
jgi:hypothetical protein